MKSALYFIVLSAFCLFSCGDNCPECGDDLCNTIDLNLDVEQQDNDAFDELDHETPFEVLSESEENLEKPPGVVLIQIKQPIDDCPCNMKTIDGLPVICSNSLKVSSELSLYLYDYYKKYYEKGKLPLFWESEMRYFLDGRLIWSGFDYIWPDTSVDEQIFSHVQHDNFLDYGIHEVKVEASIKVLDNLFVYSNTANFFSGCCENICTDFEENWLNEYSQPLSEVLKNCKAISDYPENKYLYLVLKNYFQDDNLITLGRIACESNDPIEKKKNLILKIIYNNNSKEIELHTKKLDGLGGDWNDPLDFLMTKKGKTIYIDYRKNNEVPEEMTHVLVEGIDENEKIILEDIKGSLKEDDNGFIHIVSPYYWIKLDQSLEVIDKIALNTNSAGTDLDDFAIDENGYLHLIYRNGSYYNNTNGDFKKYAEIPDLPFPSVFPLPHGYGISHYKDFVHVFLFESMMDIWRFPIYPTGKFTGLESPISDFIQDFTDVVNGFDKTYFCDPECPEEFYPMFFNIRIVSDKCARTYIPVNVKYMFSYFNYTVKTDEGKDITMTSHGERYYLITNSSGKYHTEIIADFPKPPEFTEYGKPGYLGMNLQGFIATADNTLYYSYYDPEKDSIILLSKKCKKTLR